MSSRLQITRRVTASVLSGAIGMIAIGTLATLATGCGPTIPAKPTWEEDVRPILAARCFRCHDGKGAPSPDANEKYKGLAGAPSFPDQATAEMNATLINRTVQGLDPKFMPPPPAQGLDNWQLDTIANWAATVAKK